MQSLFGFTVGLATIAGIGLASYQVGLAQSANALDAVKININNTVDGVLSSVANENRKGIEELLTPLVDLIASNINKDSAAIDKMAFVTAAGTLEKKLSDFSTISYQAAASPFVPPMNRVRFLCGEDFALTYTGQAGHSPLTSRLKINSKHISLSPGDIREFNTNDQRLIVTVLEYTKELKGPVLKYECES
ncbi:MAG: hypothetical protein AB2805_15235 [Candidatus Thiodiazotropha sp.]